MDYEKKYNYVLKRAKALKEYSLSPQIKDWVDSVFPELKESEDERIRKEIISALKYANHEGVYNKHLAWLEKQGKNNSCKFTFEDVLALECSMKTAKTIKGGDELYKILVPLYNKIHDAYLIEKQCEQKETLCDKCKKEQPSHSCQDITALGRCYIDGMNTADKVEPKFHEGDWVVNDTTLNLCHILKVKHGQYICDDCSFPITKENKYHLWTIDDAKEGDVLYSSDSNQPFIYKCRNDGEQATCYCGINKFGKFFIWNTKDCIITLDKYVPAYKEQRELLFAKMKEAGYEWDEDKKELRKIEHKITESEDEVIRKRLINICQDAILYETLADYTTKGFEECLAWLKKKGQQKWNDEDDTILLELIRRMEALDHYWNRPTDEKLIDWLKTIKQKIKEQH